MTKNANPEVDSNKVFLLFFFFLLYLSIFSCTHFNKLLIHYIPKNNIIILTPQHCNKNTLF